MGLETLIFLVLVFLSCVTGIATGFIVLVIPHAVSYLREQQKRQEQFESQLLKSLETLQFKAHNCNMLLQSLEKLSKQSDTLPPGLYEETTDNNGNVKWTRVSSSGDRPQILEGLPDDIRPIYPS